MRASSFASLLRSTHQPTRAAMQSTSSPRYEPPTSFNRRMNICATQSKAGSRATHTLKAATSHDLRHPCFTFTSAYTKTTLPKYKHLREEDYYFSEQENKFQSSETSVQRASTPSPAFQLRCLASTRLLQTFVCERTFSN